MTEVTLVNEWGDMHELGMILVAFLQQAGDAIGFVIYPIMDLDVRTKFYVQLLLAALFYFLGYRSKSRDGGLH